MSGAENPVAVLHISTTDADLARLYPWLDDAAKADALPPKLLQQMHVALDEAVSNIVLHAFSAGEEERLRVEYVPGGADVALVVSDSGKPFNPIEAPALPRGENLETLSAGGKGLILLRHFCKDISYRWAQGRNYLTLRFPRAVA